MMFLISAVCFLFFFFLMIRRPPRSTRTDTSFPTRRSSDLDAVLEAVLQASDLRQRHRLAARGRHGQAAEHVQAHALVVAAAHRHFDQDRKSTRLNSSH